MTYLSKNRVRTIMKTADGADTISKEAVLLVTRATELFIRTLVKEGYEDTKGKQLNYNNLVNVIHNSLRYEFLEIVIPKKITVRKYKELMAKKKGLQDKDEIQQVDSSSSEESDTSSSSEEET